MDLLVAASPGSRIVNLSSQTHEMVNLSLFQELCNLLAADNVWFLNCICGQGKKDIQWEDLMFEKNYDGWDVYCHSKLANILFNLELSKRLKSLCIGCNELPPENTSSRNRSLRYFLDAGISCYALHPGFIKTNITAGAVMPWYMRIGHSIIKPFAKNVEVGAQVHKI